MKKYFLTFAWCAAFLLGAGAGYGQFIRNTGIQISNTAELTATGAWTNDPGTVIHNNGIIVVRESFTNDGILDPAGAGGFRLEFSTDMSFKPGGVLPFLVKDGPGSAIFIGTAHVTDSLLLKQGVIRFANAMDTMAIMSGAFVKSSGMGYIDGLVAHHGNGNLLFPTGKNDFYLPLRIYNVQAVRVTASVIDAPAGSAGPGVEALIGFPYAWKVDEKLAADTAGYIGVEYPVALPTATNPILVRLSTGNVYRSMGARAISSDSIVRIKSYSRALRGIFTIAKGFPVDPVTDSLALVALYVNTNGPSWATRTNWTSGPVDTWHGISRSGQTITSIALPANNLSGTVPAEVAEIAGVEIIDLSDNNITWIPNFSNTTTLTSLDVSGNDLTFASLEPNASVAGFNYFNQGKFGDVLDTLIAVGQSYLLSVNAGGASTAYQWTKSGTPIAGANTSTHQLNSINRNNMGGYVLQATNPQFPGLSL
ncbi:MAG TPA: hypothetical protein VEB86_16730, partial [Chryseosolibacter sp.]|nr:hypothetical protein [Chryseosolibacter sp.]